MVDGEFEAVDAAKSETDASSYPHHHLILTEFDCGTPSSNLVFKDPDIFSPLTSTYRRSAVLYELVTPSAAYYRKLWGICIAELTGSQWQIGGWNLHRDAVKWDDETIVLAHGLLADELTPRLEGGPAVMENPPGEIQQAIELRTFKPNSDRSFWYWYPRSWH